MKSLTVLQALKMALTPADNEERIINEVVHFGLENQPYVQKDIAEAAGITDAAPNLNPLYVFVTQSQLRTILQYLRKTDGYLSAS